MRQTGKQGKWNLFKPSMQALALITLSAAVISGCSAKAATKPEDTKTAQDTQLKSVKVTPVVKQKIGNPLEQVADVIPSLQMDVVLKTGGDVQQIFKKRGDTVTEGETILKLDPKDVQLQRDKASLGVVSAQAQLNKAREDYANGLTDMQNSVKKLETAVTDAEKNYNKMHYDYDLGLVSKFQLDQVETQLKNQRMDLDALKQKQKTLETTNSLAPLEVQLQSSSLSLQESDRNLGNLDVKATVSGMLTDMPAEVRMTLSPGYKVGQIQQVDTVKIKADLTEEAAQLVRNKKELTFYVAGSSSKMKGSVNYLSNVMNTQTKAYELNLVFENKDKSLKPGTRVQIQLTDDADQVVVTVPTSSIVREGGDSFVFILNNDQVEKRKLQLGRLNELNQEVLSGVKEGEQLVISGQHQLKDKEKVQLNKN